MGANSYDYFRVFLKPVQHVSTTLDFTGNIMLPAAKTFHGSLRIENKGVAGCIINRRSSQAAPTRTAIVLRQ